MTPTRSTHKKKDAASNKKSETAQKKVSQPRFKDKDHTPGVNSVHRTSEGTREEDSEEQAP